MPLTLDERLSDADGGYNEECAWCYAALNYNEGVLFQVPGETFPLRMCSRAHAEEFEADRVARSPKARAAAQGAWELEPVGGKPAPRVPIEDLSPCEPFPTRAEVAK